MPTTIEKQWTLKAEIRGNTREEVIAGLSHLLQLVSTYHMTGGVETIPDTSIKVGYWFSEEQYYVSSDGQAVKIE